MYSLIFNVELLDNTKIQIKLELIEEEFNILKQSCNNFISVAKNNIKINDSFFSKESIVQDEIRYKVNIENQVITKEKVEVNLKNITLKTIILLLESPHKSEYCIDNNVLIPIGPAKGETKGDAGGAIEEYIINILKKINLDDGQYYLIIVNPIQFQTSLYSIHEKALKGDIKELRNLIWRNIWEKQEIRKNFIGRITNYKPISIINACTEDLQAYVNFELILNKYKDITYVTTHPAINWNKYKESIKVNKLR